MVTPSVACVINSGSACAFNVSRLTLKTNGKIFFIVIDFPSYKTYFIKKFNVFNDIIRVELQFDDLTCIDVTGDDTIYFVEVYVDFNMGTGFLFTSKDG